MILIICRQLRVISLSTIGMWMNMCKIVSYIWCHGSSWAYVLMLKTLRKLYTVGEAIVVQELCFLIFLLNNLFLSFLFFNFIFRSSFILLFLLTFKILFFPSRFWFRDLFSSDRFRLTFYSLYWIMCITFLRLSLILCLKNLLWFFVF